MRFGFYPRLALTGIRRNRQLYYPYLLTCVGMVFLYFTMASLASSPIVAEINGAATTQILLELGKNVVAIFAAIFLFYTNSFLMHRRQREFGLYNVLGMSKRNIARILFWETLFTAAVALLGDILSGVVLYKLAELALVRIMQGDVTYSINIVWNVIPQTARIFGAIFLLLFVVALLRVRLTDPIALLRSENTGEKPPKSNWLLGLAGVVILGAGYYFAVTTEDPMAVLFGFFLAVALVVVGTYLIFIAGSVMLCRLLQKNKRYYYKPNHFVSVSSMAYRMKRNGAGLASICLLATSVLVILSAGVSLVVGINDVFRQRYPTDFSLTVMSRAPLTEEQTQGLTEFLSEGMTVQQENTHTYLYALGILEDGALRFSNVYEESSSISDCWDVYILDLATYNALSGSDAALADGEVLLAFNGEAADLTAINVESVGSFAVQGTVPYLAVNPDSFLYKAALIVTADLTAFQPLMDAAAEGDSQLTAYYTWQYSFDVVESLEEQAAIYLEKSPDYTKTIANIMGGVSYSSSYDSFASSRNDYYGLFGGIFFLAVFFSVVFTLATVLIIYYKQISEGYEDAARFALMQKVGMTRRDIRRSVNSQMFTVFLLPVGMAGLHLVFACFIVRRLLLMAGLDNTPLFVGAACGCFGVFAVVYRVTSNAYYRLVSAGD
ncbi:MAG: ABC transporter permease [Clostridiales bacterium]|nr:ABC transporter permease [Clostridiales bacterium]